MALSHKSIAIETGIEFVNLTPLDINPFMSKCDIKVLYVGKNRNKSFITQDVATEMAKTLRGCPIVGYYKEQKEDFADHGDQVILDDEGIHFKTLTKPYGFVAPDALVWFQDFEDQDDFGNTVVRKYLCTTGYLWTGQYEEAKKVFEDNGKPQSMELDKKTLQGVWSEDIKDNVEFFIISDAIFQKLCILGDDVEPCYEGAGVTEPKTSTTFTLNKEYKNTLFKMMQELKFALKGESTMPNNQENGNIATEEQQINVAPSMEFSAEQGNFNESSSAENDTNVEGVEEIAATPVTEFKQDDKEKKEEKKEEAEDKVDETEEDKEDEDEKKKPTKSTLESNYEELQAKFTAMQAEYETLKSNFESLVQFKNSVEDQKKDELIAKFYMLSDEDKKEVIENKSKYSLNEIEEKLAVIGFKKGVNFSREPEQEQGQETDEVSTTFDLNSVGAEGSNLPDWVQAVKNTEKQI